MVDVFFFYIESLNTNLDTQLYTDKSKTKKEKKKQCVILFPDNVKQFRLAMRGDY